MAEKKRKKYIVTKRAARGSEHNDHKQLGVCGCIGWFVVPCYLGK
jgi:hypothetical protein